MEPASSGGSVNGNPSTEQLLKKIQQLEKLKISDEDRRHRQRSLSASPRRSKDPLGRRRTLKINDGGLGNSSSPLQRESFGLSERHHLRILQAMGQSVHVSDVEGRIIFWNRSAEHLFGFSATEALGQKANELIVDQCSFDLAADIESQVTKWGIWRGKLSVKNKRGEKFIAMTTNTPFYDDADGKLIGIICVSSDSRSFLESKLSNLATKVTNKGRSKGARMSLEGETTAVNGYPEHGCSDAASLDHKDDGASSGASTPRGDALPCPFITTFTIADKSPKKAPKFRSEETEGKMSIQNIISAKAEAWIAKKGISWPWKEQEHDADEMKNRFVWPWLHHDPETDLSLSRNAESSVRQESQAAEITRAGNNEAMGSWSSSVSSCGSTNSNAIQKLDLETDCLDYEILWEDLVIGEQIGQGSCGTVYHALWYGSDVAVKVFSKMEYSEEVISSFKQEVSLMKRLRHPNILLFMGSVTSPQRLCIVTEFLPRGSLFQLLQRATTKLDWRRRVNMALDIARGVNYLHHCNPPIFHRDLKSSNLLVDKNWTVKVGDFGLSRLKQETYLTSNTGKGTPQWMAPEVLRNEHADEKSDVYSYGVVLWELVTEKIPWDNLNSMQVIGAVGFMNQRLELPEDLSPQWVSIISSCWHSEPNLRPSFQELIERLKDLQRHYSLQSQMQRSSHRKPPLE